MPITVVHNGRTCHDLYVCIDMAKEATDTVAQQVAAWLAYLANRQYTGPGFHKVVAGTEHANYYDDLLPGLFA